MGKIIQLPLWGSLEPSTALPTFKNAVKALDQLRQVQEMNLPGIKRHFIKAPNRKIGQQVGPLCPWEHLVVYLGLSGA